MIVLPELKWAPTPNSGLRHGHPVVRVVVHRWGDRWVSDQQEEATYEAVIRWFQSPHSQVSAHLVFPGSAKPGEATQMVSWDHMAWAEAAYNPGSDEIESADAIWLGHDQEGMEVLARMVAARLHARRLPPVWSHEAGFCRHGDLGAAGGGHTACPTTDLAVWRHFAQLVTQQYHRTPFRHPWGR